MTPEQREKKRAWQAAWHAANREKVRARRAAWRAANPEKVRARQAAWHAANREKVRARQAAWRAANLEKERARNAAYRAANREKVRARNAAYRAANPEKVRVSKRRGKGLPEPLRPEPSTCECCGRPNGKRALHLDHDHLTGAFRGWLCGSCNTAIGKLGDCVEGVMRAVQYLTRAQQ